MSEFMPRPATQAQTPAQLKTQTKTQTDTPTWSTWGRTALAIALGLGMAGAVVRASTTKFWEKRKALSVEMKADQERLGLGRGHEKALYAQFPTPEIGLCKPVLAAPGATVAVTVPGKFNEKTTFLIANDQVELAAGTLVAGRYTAKATIAADAATGFAPIYAIAAVSGAYNSCPALFVGQISSYELKASNGWTIKLTPQAKTFEVGAQEAKLPYEAAFLKEGETTPFKKMSTEMTFRFNDESGKELYLSLQTAPGDGSPDGELAEIQKKMSDPKAFAKIPPKEMDRMMKRMGELTEAKVKAMSEPDYVQKLQKEQDDFGCSTLSLVITGQTPTGRLNCGKNVTKNGELKLTGTSANAS